MKISYNFLKNWIGFKESPQAVADIINLHITEVEEVISSSQYEGVVVGEIKEINPHPNADKLQLAKVDVGHRPGEASGPEGDQILDIVCGASNIAVGQKVPVALEGCVLPNGLKIKSTVIRGQRSFGMLCSKAELNLEKRSGGFRPEGESAPEGIWILNNKLKIGTPLSEVIGEDSDTIFDLKVLSNRPDYLSYLSIAREVAAVLKKDFKPGISLDFKSKQGKFDRSVAVEVKDYKLCPRYMGRVIRNVTVKPSPEWMQRILLASGLRPINNIVDISNYVLLELGQPIHAFDLDKIKDNQIIVRQAKSGETIRGLDGCEHNLENSMLVIADSQKPLAVAGIVGGEESGVTEKTKDIFLEVANFDMVSIRQTSRKLGVHTDSSARFERGLSVLLPELAIRRAINLIQQESLNCEVSAVGIDAHQKLPDATTKIEVATDQINALAGITIPPNEMVDILTRLDMPTVLKNGRLVIQIPHYRQDMRGVADVTEEILKIYGIDKIPHTMPEVVLAPSKVKDLRLAVRRIKEILVRLGFIEIYLSPFDSGSPRAVRLEKPLVSHLTHLKSDLTSGITAAEFMEGNRPADRFKVFELNTAFVDVGEVLPDEFQQLVGRIKDEAAYRQIRGALDTLLAELGIVVEYREVKGLNGMRILADKKQIGEIVRVKDNDAYFSMKIDGLVSRLAGSKKFKPLPKFPPIKFDMAFVVPDRIRIGDILDTIATADILVSKVSLFDVHHLGDEGKNIAFHIEITSEVKTLTKEDRKRVEERIQNLLSERYNAKLRQS
ncbi:phenylalanine--tRNA ligase subunit beta [candidate division Kazan bacterium]|uniref:Phenylalanine--tRNA ligase beta subunit n=1 Tax=candidate division Kazan bacterium TaxID=2202143 RepID=A0A420ZDU5_UNCK3|nr:MAG: phenylalanine--tRNA ligase subunit beta [candidate division Kazan bacterium]